MLSRAPGARQARPGLRPGPAFPRKAVQGTFPWRGPRQSLDLARCASPRRFASCRRGVAALEFALVAPVMITMMIGVVDIARAMTVQQEVYNCTHSILVSASSLAVRTDKSTSLTVTQVQQSLSTVFAAIPGRRNATLSGLTGVILTSVNFTQANPGCKPTQTSPCPYVPNVAWSVAYADPPGRNAGGANTFEAATRPCMQLNQTTPTQETPGDLTSVRTLGLTTPDPMLIVDTHYRYTPLFFSFITGPIDFRSSGYWPIRSFNPNAAATARWTSYDPANQNGGAGKCPGYP